MHQAGWSAQQRCYRSLLRSLRESLYHDRAKLFWARHRVRVEFYKYSRIDDPPAVEQLVNVGNEVAAFISAHMRVSVDRIMQHNERMMQLPVAQAKRFRSEYFEREREHESWCKQRIKAMLKRRCAPAYPFA